MHHYFFTLVQAKHLEFVSGVSATSYWLSTALWDILNAMVPVLVSTAIFFIFQLFFELDAYSGDGLFAVFLLLVCLDIIARFLRLLVVH